MQIDVVLNENAHKTYFRLLHYVRLMRTHTGFPLASSCVRLKEFMGSVFAGSICAEEFKVSIRTNE